jgi:hypothetical protein
MEEIIFVNKYTGKTEAIVSKHINNLELLIKIQLEEYDRVPLEEWRRKNEYLF